MTHAPGRWIADPRGQGRGVRVSPRRLGPLVLSTWKQDTVVGTVGRLPQEAAAGLASGSRLHADTGS